MPIFMVENYKTVPSTTHKIQENLFSFLTAGEPLLEHLINSLIHSKKIEVYSQASGVFLERAHPTLLTTYYLVLVSMLMMLNFEFYSNLLLVWSSIIYKQGNHPVDR